MTQDNRYPNESVAPERIPPQDIEAEKSVLGAMLLSKDAIADVTAEIRGEDYYRVPHETIHNAIVELYGRGEPADAITVARELERKGELSRVGGAPYLYTLSASVPTAANAGYYAKIVREQAILRNLVEAGTRVAQLGYSEAGEVDDLVDKAQQEVYAITERRTSEDYVLVCDVINPLVDELEAIEENKGKLMGVGTGLTDLDAVTNGLQAGQMIIIAARPAMGKSTLALDIARHCAIKEGKTAVMFSLEMSRSEITMRLLAAEASVFFEKMRTGNMDSNDWDKLVRVTGKVSESPFFIDDSPNMTMTEIRSKCRRLKQRNQLELVVVDYLQLMSSNKKVESRQQEVSEFSRSLKLLAKELEVPVIAVAQLNRGPEMRGDKKPLMADLRESGSLEQDADIVILLHRPEMYASTEDEKKEKAGEAEIIVAKNRNGRTGTVPALFQGHYARFVSQQREF